MPTASSAKPGIYTALAKVLEELPAIGKNQTNQGQGFKFRGIDDVLNALNPVLAKHGVFFVPNVVERIANQRTTRNGGVMFEVNLHVEYTFFAADGTSVMASGWGEGTDSGDKATNKAMTAAMKYVLFQVFAIATSDAMDADSTTADVEYEATPPARAQSNGKEAKAKEMGYRDADHYKASHDALRDLLKEADVDNPLAAADFRGWLETQGHKKPPLPADVMEQAVKWWKDEANTKPSGADEEDSE